MMEKRPSCGSTGLHFRYQVLPVDPQQTLLRKIAWRKMHNICECSHFSTHELTNSIQCECGHSVTSSLSTNSCIVFPWMPLPVGQDLVENSRSNTRIVAQVRRTAQANVRLSPTAFSGITVLTSHLGIQACRSPS